MYNIVTTHIDTVAIQMSILVTIKGVKTHLNHHLLSGWCKYFLGWYMHLYETQYMLFQNSTFFLVPQVSVFMMFEEYKLSSLNL